MAAFSSATWANDADFEAAEDEQYRKVQAAFSQGFSVHSAVTVYGDQLPEGHMTPLLVAATKADDAHDFRLQDYSRWCSSGAGGKPCPEAYSVGVHRRLGLWWPS